jgi:hypothetical protein
MRLGLGPILIVAVAISVFVAILDNAPALLLLVPLIVAAALAWLVHKLSNSAVLRGTDGLKWGAGSGNFSISLNFGRGGNVVSDLQTLRETGRAVSDELAALSDKGPVTRISIDATVQDARSLQELPGLLREALDGLEQSGCVATPEATGPGALSSTAASDDGRARASIAISHEDAVKAVSSQAEIEPALPAPPADELTEKPGDSGAPRPVAPGKVSSARTAAHLRIIEGRPLGEEFALDHATTRIGRSVACEVALDDETVSYEHARIVQQDDGWLLQDLMGTHLNGQILKEQRVLKGGDTITIGRTRLRFEVT